MHNKRSIIAIISAMIVFVTGTLIVLANQENEFDIPHEHEYQITAFDCDTGIVSFTCMVCDDEKTERFIDHINERNDNPIDVNHDGIVNAKDFAYLMKYYSNNQQ